MKYCLDKQSLEDFLKNLRDSQKFPIEDENLKAVIEGAYTWDFEVSIITYFFTTYIQRKANAGIFDTAELKTFYNIANLGGFILQEFDKNFVEYLFNYSRPKMKMTLEEILVTVQQDLSDNNYESDLRY